MIVSPNAARPLYEILLEVPGGALWDVPECGTFTHERDAIHIAGLLRSWLHECKWNDNLTDMAEDPVEAGLELFALRDILMSQGIDPAAVKVLAERAPELSGGWNRHPGHGKPAPKFTATRRW